MAYEPRTESFKVEGLNSPILWELLTDICPEMYNVYYVGRLVANIRERHGHITVCPVVNYRTDTSVYLYEATGENLKSHSDRINEVLVKYIKETRR